MELLASAWEIVMHLDVHLADFVAAHGAWVYALLFAIVFVETGLVIWPFLPGDSLLFVTGALAAAGVDARACHQIFTGNFDRLFPA